MNLQQAVASACGIQVGASLSRHETDGWYLQGETPQICITCKSALIAFRCPYISSGKTYRYWALICPKCSKVVSLDEFSDKEKAALRKWDAAQSEPANSALSRKQSRTEGQNSDKSKVLRPTAEQLAVVEAANRGVDLVVNALAGTGKTTTLKLIANSLSSRRGTYIAFNRSIVDEARKKFPTSMNCTTAHGLAFRAIGKKFKSRLDDPRVSDEDLATMFDARRFRFRTDNESYVYESEQIAGFALGAVKKFCKSLDSEIMPDHVPTPVLVRSAGEDDVIAQAFEEVVVDVAARMWEDILKPKGKMKFDHDYYLKMWQLTEPKIPGDVILFDESQDADLVMLEVVRIQSHAQVIYCGDEYQSIYEWRGAVNALNAVYADEHLWLTQSFRFGNEIAAEANKFLRLLKSPKLVEGYAGRKSSVGALSSPDAVLCRTNFGVVVSLREMQARNLRTALPDGSTEILRKFARGCLRLIQGGRSGHPDLAPFADWKKAVFWATHGLDQMSEPAMLIRLINSVGAGELLEMLDRVVNEDEADVVITSAHKAKGREWNTVTLAGDFQHPLDMSESELKLAYVAVTRARDVLDISNLPKTQGARPILFDDLTVRQPIETRTPKIRPPIPVDKMRAGDREERGALGRLRKDSK